MEEPPLSREQWLEILLIRLTEAQEANTDGLLALQEIVEKKLDAALKAQGSSDRRSEERLAEIQLLFTDFLERNAVIVDGVKQIAGASTKATKSLKTIQHGVKAIRENTGKHPRYEPDELEEAGEAPKTLRRWGRKAGEAAVNAIWPVAMRTGWRAVLWIVSAVTGSALFAAAARGLHFLITHAHHP